MSIPVITPNDIKTHALKHNTTLQEAYEYLLENPPFRMRLTKEQVEKLNDEINDLLSSEEL